MTQYEKVLQRYPNGRVTLYKSIKRFMPSDLLEFGEDETDDNDFRERTEEEMEHCWNLEYKGGS